MFASSSNEGNATIVDSVHASQHGQIGSASGNVSQESMMSTLVDNVASPLTGSNERKPVPDDLELDRARLRRRGAEQSALAEERRQAAELFAYFNED